MNDIPKKIHLKIGPSSRGKESFKDLAEVTWGQEKAGEGDIAYVLEQYDSNVDTMKHIRRVADLLTGAAKELLDRAMVHDASKLASPEKELFDEYTPKLKGTTYGSDEYYEHLKGLRVALDHHYLHNSHHPEHYSNGIDGMDLFDLIEMFFDWKAASERHADGDIFSSIEKNEERFGISEQLCNIFRNTAWRLGYE